MKLFSEYFSGHVSHDFHLFGNDDMDFLHQFPQSVWARAIEERYGLDLPAALTQREEARRKKIKGFNKGYYETIQDAADGIYQGLTHKGNQPEEITRIRESAYNNAKNFIDSELAQRPDGGGAWMNVNYPRTVYNFVVRKQVISTTIKNNYIRELVDRLEGPRGASTVGFDLSKIRNFDPENPVGNWYTVGFTCPQVKQISNNLQSWVTYASQGLLHAPNTIPDPEAHRQRVKTTYAPNAEATEKEIEEDIYKTPLYNKYIKYIKELEEKFINEELTQEDVTLLKKKFQLKNPITDNYSYLSANRGTFADELRGAPLNIRTPYKMTFDNLTHIVQHAEHSAKFEEQLVKALIDIDLITYPIQNYHGEEFDTMSFSKLRHPTVANPHHPGQTMPELLPGKILFNINQTIEKLQKKVADAEAKEDPDEANRLRDLIRNLEANRRVGHHYDPRDIEQPNKKRKPIFYQFDNERDVPEDLDKRDRTLAGGVYPNKSSEYEAGPGRQDLNQNLENLMLVMGDDDLFDKIVKDFIKENYKGRFNIFLKTFYDPEEGITSPTTYLAFKNLIKDKALRNLRLFNLTRPIAPRLAQTAVSQTLRSLMSNVSAVLYKKNLGVSGPMRKRFGKDADAAAVRIAIGEMIEKAVT